MRDLIDEAAMISLMLVLAAIGFAVWTFKRTVTWLCGPTKDTGTTSRRTFNP